MMTEPARMMVPALRRKPFTFSQVIRNSVRAWGMRYGGSSTTNKDGSLETKGSAENILDSNRARTIPSTYINITTDA
ncbi:hypothetical protein D1872_334360 [compost metagenome]